MTNNELISSQTLHGTAPKDSHLRIVMIGMGLHGLHFAKHLVEQSRTWKLAAVVDPSAAAYARFQSLFHSREIPFYKSVQDAEGIETADLIFVTTTAPYHIRVTKEVIERGYQRSILIEKPISNSLMETESLLSLMRESAWKGRIAVDFNRRCAPLYLPVYECARDNTYGTLRHIQYTRKCKISMKGAHYVDLAIWFSSSVPVQASAQLNQFSDVDYRGAYYFDPEGCLEVTFANGVTFELDGTGTDKKFDEGMTLVFDQGQIHVDLEETCARAKSNIGDWSELVRDVSPRTSWMENVCNAMVSSSSQFAPCPVGDAVLGLEVLVSAYWSNLENGAPIALPLSLEQRQLVLKVA